MTERFSRRQGYSEAEAEITVRHDAPDELRAVVVELAYESGLQPSQLRQIVCRVLRTAPNPSNWSEYPNCDGEVRELLRDREWHHVYDAIEEIYTTLSSGGMVAPGRRGSVDAAQYFSEEINRYFRGRGIGWQLAEGQIEVRGPESFAEVVHSARDSLEEAGRTTAASELHEAILDLSRRPEPDVTGAIQHAMAALECVARDVAGNQKLTLGDLIKRYPDLFPKPLDQVIEKAWGYASETGRHLKEGKSPAFEEAELVVGLSGTVCRYLARKIST